MKRIIYVVCMFMVLLIVSLSCDRPNKLTPKVDSVTEDYLIPQGKILTSEDRAEIQARWDEYNTGINE